MRLSIASITLLVVSVLGVATAEDAKVVYGICACFNPKYDASCCIPAKGYMMNDGNVCSTPKDSIETYQACCTRSGGRSKCKHGLRDANDWPPADTYGCKA